jgi:hypothetical protein
VYYTIPNLVRWQRKKFEKLNFGVTVIVAKREQLAEGLPEEVFHQGVELELAWMPTQTRGSGSAAEFHVMGLIKWFRLVSWLLIFEFNLRLSITTKKMLYSAVQCRGLKV